MAQIKRSVGRPRKIFNIEDIPERQTNGKPTSSIHDAHGLAKLAIRRKQYQQNKLELLANTTTDMAKICAECKISKPLLADFYKMGKYFYKNCKECYNISKAKKYVPKSTFYTLPLDIRAKIIYDYSCGDDVKDIYDKYKALCPILIYDHLLSWDEKGLIPMLTTKIYTEKHIVK